MMGEVLSLDLNGVKELTDGTEPSAKALDRP